MKYPNSSQLLLIFIATLLLILVAFSFYLLRDPSAPLPFSGLPALGTSTPLYADVTGTQAQSKTTLPTRQTSYTPFATRLVSTAGFSPVAPIQSATVSPGGTSYPPPINLTLTAISSRTVSPTSTPNTPTITAPPSSTATLAPGQIGVTGLVVLNSVPQTDVVVEFADDIPSRQNKTNTGGHYWFTTNAPGTHFTLTFSQSDNPNLSPAQEIASLAWLEGSLPTTGSPIDLPNLEISLDLSGMFFQPQFPADGATFSASIISPSNKIQFVWSLYNLGETYYVELGPNGEVDPIWTSDDTTANNLDWDGILDNGNQIASGAYWWRVTTTKMIGTYSLNIVTQTQSILFNP